MGAFDGECKRTFLHRITKTINNQQHEDKSVMNNQLTSNHNTKPQDI